MGRVCNDLGTGRCNLNIQYEKKIRKERSSFSSCLLLFSPWGLQIKLTTERQTKDKAWRWYLIRTYLALFTPHGVFMEKRIAYRKRLSLRADVAEGAHGGEDKTGERGLDALWGQTDVEGNGGG